MRSNKASAVAIVILALACAATTQSKPELLKGIDQIQTEDQLGEWMTYYYIHPQPALTVSALQLMAQKGWLTKEDAQAPMVAFYAALFRQSPEQMASCVSAAKKNGTEDQKAFVALAVWSSGAKNRDELLSALGQSGSDKFKKYVQELRVDSNVPDLLRDEISSPSFLDALWATFFETGDDRYVKRIIEVLPWIDAKGDTANLLIGGAAQWSLSSNAHQHPRVMQICEAQLSSGSVQQTAVLQKVIKSAKDSSNK